MSSARSPATGRPRNVDNTPTRLRASDLGALRSASPLPFAPKPLLGLLSVLHFFEVVVVILDVALVAARQHVNRVLDLARRLVAFARSAAVALLAQVHLLA